MIRVPPFLCSSFLVSVSLPHPREEYADFSSPKLIIRSLEGKPVLTINSTSTVSRALWLDAGDTEWKAGLLHQWSSFVMGEAKLNTQGDTCSDGNGRSLCQVPVVSEANGRPRPPPSPPSGLLLPRRAQVVLAPGSGGMFPGGVESACLD